jgi:predicted O-methyltransferase YrrM
MLLSKNKRLRQIVGVLETGNLLFLRLLVRNRGATAVFPGEVYRTYMGHAREGRWSCRSVFEVLPKTDRVRFEIEHIPSDFIDTPLEQLACLALITRVIQPKTVFEIGTFRGRTALNFALNAPEDAKVYTLDLPPAGRDRAIAAANPADGMIIRESATGCEYHGSDVEPKIEQLLGDSRSFDFSPYYGKIDLVHIDGAHDYAAVRRDSDEALRMLRPGGYALWDEFCNYGDYNDVTRAVLDVVPKGGVVQIENTQLAVYRKPEAA